MKFYLNLIIVLLVIGGVASGILAYVNKATAPIIAKQQKDNEEKARKEVLPEAVTFEKDSLAVEVEQVNDPFIKSAGDAKPMFYYWKGFDAGKQLVGYVFVGERAGYSSRIRTMCGVKPDFSINQIKVIYQSETPGLGTHSQDADFPVRFAGLAPDQLKVDKDGGKVKSITGATISTRAITRSLAEGIANLKKALESAAPVVAPSDRVKADSLNPGGENVTR